ncbi:hypothetical protein [Rhodococcus sp. W8901]|uniref:hypothetical protein n=1 Tax=Rhodococcus sp. W8901 TaxID=2742603 RepID=UPI0020C74456|nr:hypothetical protein [Rhodococcus sp. W8901]
MTRTGDEVGQPKIRQGSIEVGAIEVREDVAQPGIDGEPELREEPREDLVDLTGTPVDEVPARTGRQRLAREHGTVAGHDPQRQAGRLGADVDRTRIRCEHDLPAGAVERHPRRGRVHRQRASRLDVRRGQERRERASAAGIAHRVGHRNILEARDIQCQKKDVQDPGPGRRSRR